MRNATARRAEVASDEQLLERFALGSDAAFEELVRRHGPGIKAYAQRLLRSETEAEDIYVETFARVVQQRANLRRAGTTRGFLYTIAHRLCVSRVRRRQTVYRYAPQLVALEGGRSRGATSEELASAAELAADLERAIAGLSEEHRQVLMLRAVHGLSTRETAEAVGLGEAQVRSRLSWARKRLRALMASEAGRDVGGEGR